jgi:type II secretory ATPase GspE/PulE/Tfp pilus assembly ATPase PilB-like protein/ActR/RegA family two-component response regulator
MPNTIKGTTLQRVVPSQDEMKECAALARSKRVPLTDLLVKERQYSEEALAEGFVDWLKLPRVRIASLTLDPEAAKTISEKVATKHACLPLKLDDLGRLVVAMANPADYDAIQDVQFVSGYSVQPVVATRTEIMDGIQEVYGTEDRMKDLLAKVSDGGSDFVIITEETDKIDLDRSDSRSAAELAPVVKMCNLILQEAVRSSASDVHLEPTLNCLQVRMRVDGVLREYIDVPKWLHHPLISRFKILACLDIAERRLPQDGRIRVKCQSRSIDIRASTLPTHFGEKLVLRILGTSTIPTLESLELTEWQFAAVTQALSQPQGTILLTGPTGSGKTTTLYSLIARRRSPEVNIVTVEDPIEYQLPGINQVQVNVKAGLTFAGSLRSILRQDPDVILVGEVRDLETAEIAFQAAITGHLVLSTLHTNSSFAVVARLVDLGVDPAVVGASLNLVVAQRLARRICLQCKEPYTPEAAVMRMLKIEKPDTVFYRGRGCAACSQTGYAGRLGIYEMLRVNAAIKELVRRKAGEAALRRAAAMAGTTTLLEDGLSKVLAGLTTIEEVLRVVEVETEETYPCPQCRSQVNRDFMSCPFCMHNLRVVCESCRQDLKPEWKMCPYCTTPTRPAAQSSSAEPSATAPAPSPKFLMPSSSHDENDPRERAALPEAKRPKILVVDDDPGIMKIIETTLKQLPVAADIFTASDGVEALAAIEKHGADVLILDVMMPRMDGFAVCDALRKDIRTAFLPILMLTANGDQAKRTQAYMVGTDDYMSKPFEVDDFLARVNRLLRRTYGL